MKKSTQNRIKEFLIFALTAAVFAIIYGNALVYLGPTYFVPGINLELITFISLLGWSVATFMVAFLISRRK